MCYSPSPAGMRCSPSNLVFVRIFKSSNELSFEDFSSFEYSPSPSRRLDDPLDFGSQVSEEYDPDYVVVNEVFDVSAEFDTCRQVIVESGVTRPYLDLILGKSVPNPHTPIFGDPKYAWLTPLSTYGRCFGKCLSADCKDVAVERDLPCALVARAFPFAVPNKKGTPTPIICMLALVEGRAGVKTVP